MIRPELNRELSKEAQKEIKTMNRIKIPKDEYPAEKAFILDFCIAPPPVNIVQKKREQKIN